MSHLMDYYRRVQRWHPDVKHDVCTILSQRQCVSPDRAICLAELREAYKEYTEHDFPIKGEIVIQLDFLMTIPYVGCFSNVNGTMFFYLIEQCNGA